MIDTPLDEIGRPLKSEGGHCTSPLTLDRTPQTLNPNPLNPKPVQGSALSESNVERVQDNVQVPLFASENVV